VAAQEMNAAEADYVVRLPAAHMPRISRPNALAEALGRTEFGATISIPRLPKLSRAEFRF
jgi:hypothetical protein